MKIVVLDGHALNSGDLSWEPLRALGELQVFDRTSEDQIVERAQDTEIVLTTRTHLSAQILRQLKKTRYIGVLFTGYDIVDVKAARELGITVTKHSDLRYGISSGTHVCAATGAVPSRRSSQ